jgi:hypothetical protein
VTKNNYRDKFLLILSDITTLSFECVQSLSLLAIDGKHVTVFPFKSPRGSKTTTGEAQIAPMSLSFSAYYRSILQRFLSLTKLEAPRPPGNMIASNVSLAILSKLVSAIY